VPQTRRNCSFARLPRGDHVVILRV
jgi:hypothetical protein